jgi:hypothetical protein
MGLHLDTRTLWHSKVRTDPGFFPFFHAQSSDDALCLQLPTFWLETLPAPKDWKLH